MITVKEIMRSCQTPSEEVERLMQFVHEAFFDDAGTDAGSEFTVCAGYLSNHRQWRSFEIKWGRLLRSYHVRPEKFSMKDLAALDGEFKQWKEHQRRSFLNAALPLIRDRVEVGFISVVRKRVYQAYVSKEVRQHIGNDFCYCAQFVIAMMECYLQCRNASHRLVWITFEKGTKGLGKLQDACEEQFEHFSMNREFSRADKRCLPLHAADVIAYESRKLYASLERVRYPIKQLVHNIPHWIMGLDGCELAQLDSVLKQAGIGVQ